MKSASTKMKNGFAASEEELRRGAPSRTLREDAARQAARQNTETTRTSIRCRRNQTIKSAELPSAPSSSLLALPVNRP